MFTSVVMSVGMVIVVGIISLDIGFVDVMVMGLIVG